MEMHCDAIVIVAKATVKTTNVFKNIVIETY